MESFKYYEGGPHLKLSKIPHLTFARVGRGGWPQERMGGRVGGRTVTDGGERGTS